MATQPLLTVVYGTEKGLAASFARSIPPRPSDLTVVEGPLIAGDALGLLGWLGLGVQDTVCLLLCGLH